MTKMNHTCLPSIRDAIGLDKRPGGGPIARTGRDAGRRPCEPAGVWWRLALACYWVALAVATHYPRVRIPGELPNSDKLVHFTVFGLLALLCWQVMATYRPLTARSVWLVAIVLVAYAALDEFTQQFVGRHSDVMDWIANTAGILCVLAVLELRRRVTARRRAR